MFTDPSCLAVASIDPSVSAPHTRRYLHLLFSASALLSPTLVASESCFVSRRKAADNEVVPPARLSLSLSLRGDGVFKDFADECGSDGGDKV